jgi:hypothetical protein
VADVLVRAPRRADIAELVANLRAGDRAELEASNPGDPHDAVRHALAVSPHRWAMEVDGQLALLGGVSPVSLVGGIGSPWLLGTTVLERRGGVLTRVCLGYRDLALGLYPVLVNYVDARNATSIRWLKRLGFSIADEPVPYGPKGLPFYRFELRSDDV